MNLHLLWLWMWFIFGMITYMLKRSYFLVTGPNPVANNYTEFWIKCWIPLFVRAVEDSAVYWVSFYPDVLNPILSYFGISFQLHSALPEFGVVALLFGLFVDSAVDFAVTKIPIIRDWQPQMPPPLPQKAIVQSTMTETKTKVSQLATTTTVIQQGAEDE